MTKPIILHTTLSADTPYTFYLGVYTTNFLVKNLTEGTLSVSYGEAIDNKSYSLLPTYTAEELFVSSIDKIEARTDKITVSSTGAGVVEIRLLDF